MLRKIRGKNRRKNRKMNQWWMVGGEFKNLGKDGLGEPMGKEEYFGAGGIWGDDDGDVEGET